MSTHFELVGVKITCEYSEPRMVGCFASEGGEFGWLLALEEPVAQPPMLRCIETLVIELSNIGTQSPSSRFFRSRANARYNRVRV